MLSENKHLRQMLQHYNVYRQDEQIPLEVLMDLQAEMKVSNLLMPLKEDGEDFLCNYIHIEGSKFLPLFTNEEELDKHDGSKTVCCLTFDEYIETVEDQGLDGIVIDCESEAFTFDNEFLNEIPPDAVPNVIDNGEAYGAEELKEIFENTSSDSVIEKRIENLFVEISDSVLLDIIYFDESQDDTLKDGILLSDDFDGFRLYVIDDDGLKLAPVFTKKENLMKALPDDKACYGQITKMFDLVEFILRNDIDGFVINPGVDDRIIHRDYLLSQARGIEIVIDDSRFADALDYAFKL